MYRRPYAGGAMGCGPAYGGYWGRAYRRPKYNVPINVADNKTYYEVYVYALGFSKEDIKVAVVDDMLYVTGTRPIDENYKPNFRLQEYPIKSFERVLQLNGKVDAENIRARQENGVLIVTLPKSPDAQPPVQEVEIV